MITASTSIAMNVSGCAKFERCPGLRTEGVGAGRCATPAAGAVELDTVFADDVLYLEWKATGGGRRIEDAIDTFIFQNGMIPRADHRLHRPARPEPRYTAARDAVVAAPPPKNRSRHQASPRCCLVRNAHSKQRGHGRPTHRFR
jgi:hypothetical protein